MEGLNRDGGMKMVKFRWWNRDGGMGGEMKEGGWTV